MKLKTLLVLNASVGAGSAFTAILFGEKTEKHKKRSYLLS